MFNKEALQVEIIEEVLANFPMVAGVYNTYKMLGEEPNLTIVDDTYYCITVNNLEFLYDMDGIPTHYFVNTTIG